VIYLNKVRNRNGEEFIIKESASVSFLYGTFFGRVFAKLFSLPFFSKVIGYFLSSRFSKFLIKRFVRNNNIDLSVFEKNKFNSFNDFFTRRLNCKNVVIDMEKDIFVSPCDAKLLCYEVSEKSEFSIKNSFYRIDELLGGNPIYKNYIGGYALIFRLCADDYHRYMYVDNGYKEKNIFIKGVLNTVRPVALEHINLFKKNSREYTVLHTENFDDVVQIEVGAVLVGKINNFHEDCKFKKGEEKGMFEFGGSTIVLLVKKDKVVMDKDIIVNSNEDVETLVKYGRRIGKKF
jgi:phosphatidylserine decarboxylase